jgi:type IV pilus assembly protein PilQ
MLGSISSRIRRLGVIAGSGLLAAGVIACAASTALRPEPQQQPGEIADVRVEREGGVTVVTLVGLEQPVFTAFAQQDPERVVVDLASVGPEGLMDPVPVHDGLVEEVSLLPFSTGVGDAMTRVEVSLTAPADFNVVSTDEGLAIELASLAGGEAAELPGGGGSEGWTEETDPWATEAMSGETAEAAQQMPMLEEAPVATTLEAIEVQDVGMGSLIHLRADGVVSSVVAFTLEDPDRLVIDLPGLASAAAEERVDVDSAHATSVRMGRHADKVRVVVDAGSELNPFEGRRTIPVPDGLLIVLGSGESLEWAVAEAVAATAETESAPEAEEWDTPDSTGSPDLEVTGIEAGADAEAQPGLEVASEEMAAAEADWEREAAAPEEMADAEPQEIPAVIESASESLATIYGVEFDTQDERDRIVVVGDQPVDYIVYEPDPETVVLSFAGADIDPEAAVRIAPESSGPVSLITAFEQPDVERSEVRIVVKRAANLAPQVSRRGSLLFVDFPHTGAMATTPPVLAALPSEPLLTEPEAPSSQTVLADSTPMPAAAPAVAQVASTTAPAAIAPSAAPPASLEPPAAIDILEEGGLIDGKEYAGRRISLDFKDVEIADVLRLIAEVSDLNVIAGDEVKGAVTIRLVDVPWDQALDVILLTKSLGFMRVGNVLRVAPADVIKQEEEMRLQERRAKEKLEDLVVKLQPVNYADAGEISPMVQRLLSPRGTVNVDTRTNTLIIKDIASVVDEATALVKAIDTQTPQVMIEAKIVEASLDFSREFGSVWTVGSQPLVDGFDDGSAPRQDLGWSDFRLHDQNNFSSLNGITAGPTALANLGAFILDEKINLNLQLQAAEVNGDGKVISSPRVVTLDNSEARIEQGVSIPFQTFEDGDAGLEFVDAVLALNVTPHITADRSIIMKIKVSRNAPDDSVFTLTGSPAIGKNQVETETLVRDGRTLVLGGIYVIDKSQRQSRVPYLHQIPFLGAAFRSDEQSDSRKELLIFVTPHVVVSEPLPAS